LDTIGDPNPPAIFSPGSVAEVEYEKNQMAFQDDAVALFVGEKSLAAFSWHKSIAHCHHETTPNRGIVE